MHLVWYDNSYNHNCYKKQILFNTKDVYWALMQLIRMFFFLQATQQASTDFLHETAKYTDAQSNWCFIQIIWSQAYIHSLEQID